MTTPSLDTSLRRVQIRPGHPDFLDLPWAQPLADWSAHTARVTQVQRGLSRHEVVFVCYDDAIYAVKELPEEIGEREYNLLRELEARRLPAVAPVGHVLAERAGGEAVSLLITRYLDASLPYRSLFMQRRLERYRRRLMGTMASLLVRLHLSGFYWGDCSLSNTLFRRDADALQAYVVDAETSEVHELLSDGQRMQDLEILDENVTGELADLAAMLELPEDVAVYETGRAIIRRYQRLWKEINREELIQPGEHYHIRERIRALNDMGFSVDEVELVPTADGSRLRMRTIVTDRDYHSRQLHSLTGIIASDVQARQVIHDIFEFRASLARSLNRSVPTSNAAFRWLDEVYSPALKQLTPLIDSATDIPELYCEVLEHKWYLSERARKDVGMEAAIANYVAWRQSNAGDNR
ncbi:MAG: DUF4032 domain-containing protein [Chloroflexi bacterium]|nr:DUF4032 domain-containing protein [Chloroflexota bacterium]MBI3734520.1 DUF4032 domain-containing protein [Chloroflexota bacterium]